MASLAAVTSGELLSRATPPSLSKLRSSGRSILGRIQGLVSIRKSKRPSAALIVISPASRDFEQVFRFFDEDGDGMISAVELRSGMRRSSGEELSLEEAAAVVESSDSDGDGKLGYEEFLRLVVTEEGDEKERNLREAFAAYETEGKGCITAASLQRALRRLGEERRKEECRDMIKRFDVNGDGVICFEEFKLMMM
ncbi:putative calcium-binding protein CML31 [Apostasia shenzhenica]|uniref:Putative calcium-binding protein CML31 n=1 Tax=Apostasia shenzhenica TaxID=1088818 RepID=A0A2I0ALX8_9ASPA|nr:putative calcium-binding protein CML31 [Apostasia shenzhenica]